MRNTTSTTSQNLVHHKRAGLVLVGIAMAVLSLLALQKESQTDKNVSHNHFKGNIEMPVSWSLTTLKAITSITQ